MSETALLQVDHLSAVSGPEAAPVLRDVSLTLRAGEVHGLLGESGAGKSTIAKAVLGILPRAIRVTGGTIRLGGRDLLATPERERRRLVSRQIAFIPQDPLSALNPARRIEGQITDAMRLTGGLSRTLARARALKLLAEVRIREPERVLAAFPHELSGGMRQRVLIAAAFSAEPKLVVADEPTTALDVTVQKEILRLIRRLGERHGTGVLFVTHDLGVVAQICDRVTLLFMGRAVEAGATADILARPAHAYTRALLAASPRPDTADAGLHPVPDAVFAALRAEIAAFDRGDARG